MKLIKTTVFICCMVFGPFVFASDLGDIVNILQKIQGYQKDQLTQLNSIDGLLGELKSNTSGAKYNGNVEEKYQQWDASAQDWDSFLGMTESGGGGEVGTVVDKLNNQFPIKDSESAFNKVNGSKMDQEYYKLQAETALASRAASQHEFDEIEKEIKYQKQLESEAKNTNDLKASLDMQNKLQVENNLIMLSVLRQLSIANQQKALDTQEAVNSAFENASFLQKK